MHDIHPSIARLLALPEAVRRIGPFVLVRQLGRGGFAPVWLAKEVYGAETLRAAAVKLFAIERGAGDASRRIVEEARALCRVEHRGVVRFYSLAVDEGAGVMGLGMEHLAGRSLAARLEAAGSLRVEQVVELGIALASALAAVHRAGLVHRDVKPANIVETASGYKLIDFGIASARTAFPMASSWAPSDDPDCTGRVAELQSGTLGYVDPVTIATGAPASSESDLYALGVTLFECLTGRLPSGVRGEALDPRILDGRAASPPVGALAKEAPAALATIVDRMVRPERTFRYGSAEEVLAALERLHASPTARAWFVPVLAAAAPVIAIVSGIGTWAVYERALRAEAAAPQRAPTTEAPERQHEPAPPRVVTAPPPEVRPASQRAAVVVDEPGAGKARTSRGATPRLVPKSYASTASVVAPAKPPDPPHSSAPPPAPQPPAPLSSGRGSLPLAPARDW